MPCFDFLSANSRLAAITEAGVSKRLVDQGYRWSGLSGLTGDMYLKER
jgi:hypothetical protein